MIMTHQKPKDRLRGAVAGERRIALMPTAGSYQVSCTLDQTNLDELIEETGATYIVVGAVLPAQSGAELCRLMQGGNGVMPYPIMLLTHEDGAGENGPAAHNRVQSALNQASGRLSRLPAQAEEADGEGIVIDPAKHEVMMDGEPVDLNSTEFKLLQLFMNEPGFVLSRDRIIEVLRGKNYHCTPRTVDVMIVGLRRKLGPYASRIKTVRGVGYRYRE